IIAANPARSDRSIAKDARVDPKTIAAIRKEGEDVGTIPHIAPTDRVDAGGRKRARKTTGKAKKTEAQPEQVAPQDQPGRAPPQFSLRELPFDAAVITVKEWFAALPISQQTLALETLETANEVDQAMGDVEAIERTAVREPDQEEAAAT